MIQYWGMYGATWFFAVINIVLATILFFFLPETQGKSIEEITAVLAKRAIHVN